MLEELSFADSRPSQYLNKNYFAYLEEFAKIKGIQLALLHEAHDCLYEKHTFEESSTGFLSFCTPEVRNRFFSWLDFLAAFKNSDRYESALNAVLWCLLEQKFLSTQTTFQFETCKHYFAIVLSSENFIPEHDAMRNLILSLCILSIRPDLQKRSVSNACKIMAEGWNNKLNWFQLIFGHGEAPAFFGKHLEKLSIEEIEIFLNILDGKSLRKLLKEIEPISQNENNILLNHTLEIGECEDSIVLRYIIAVRMLKFFPEEPEKLKQLLRASKYFRNSPSAFLKDIPFWQSVFRFVIKMEESTQETITTITDYFEFKRYRPTQAKAYSIKGKTIASVEREIEEWHNGQDFTYTNKELEITWLPMEIPLFQYLDNAEKYFIEEIIIGRDLLKEGKKMKHCVFTYLDNCTNGHSHIFSFYSIIGKTKKHLATIEVSNNAIVQVSGMKNSPILDSYNRIIQKWRENNKLL